MPITNAQARALNGILHLQWVNVGVLKCADATKQRLLRDGLIERRLSGSQHHTTVMRYRITEAGKRELRAHHVKSSIERDRE